MTRFIVVVAALALVSCGDEAHALSQRTFVSAGGSDSNLCTVAAPCRSFGAAMANTLPGGEIIPLDSAGYGSVTITQAVTIAVPPGVHAGITVTSGHGIDIQAGANDVVVLRGLTLAGFVAPVGIDVVTARSVFIEDCDLSGFDTAVRFHPSQAAFLSISDSVMRANSHAVDASGDTPIAFASRVEIWRSKALGNGTNGFNFRDIVRAVIADSYVGGGSSGASGISMFVTTNSTTNPSIAIERTAILDNGTGLSVEQVSGPFTGVVNVAGSTIAGNQTGISTLGNALVRLTTSQLTGNGTPISLFGTGGAVDTLSTNMRYGNDSAGDAPGTLAPN